MDDKKKLSSAVSFLVDVLVATLLAVISIKLREASRQTGLAWQGGLAVWAFTLEFLYFGVKIFRISWKEVRSWPGHPRGLFFYLLPPKFWGAISILIGVGFMIQ